MDAVDVAIIGGGCAGTLVAAQLMRGRRPLAVALIERRMPPGRGVAYGTAEAGHLLNIPVGEMSAWPDDPGHFGRWLEARGLPGGYAPRAVYGAYLEAVLEEAIAQAAPGRRVVSLADEAVGLLPAGDRFRLRLASGETLLASQVVVAVGQFPPAPLRLAEGSAWYVDDAWSPQALAPMTGEALLIGTGLTGVDLAVSLLEHAGAARVTMVSRRAQLPAASYAGPAYRDWFDPTSAPVRISQLLRQIKREIKRAEREDVDWRAVIDALKPHVSALWARLPLVERRRFLRHARSFWEAARNRLPPPTALRLEALRAAGRLEVLAARVRRLADHGDQAAAELALRAGGERAITVRRVINCTGPDTQYRQISHPLILDLVGTGLARPEPLGLGLDTAPDGRLKDEDGLASRPLYTLGWPRIGQLWEATTVPSLRSQAEAIARRIDNSLTGS